MGSEKMPSVWVVLDPRDPDWSEICNYKPNASAYVFPVRIVEYVPKEAPVTFQNNRYCGICHKTLSGYEECPHFRGREQEQRIREIVREEIGKVRIKQTEPRAVGDVWKWRYDLKLIPQGEK